MRSCAPHELPGCVPNRALAKEVPAGDGWLDEVKFDGYPRAGAQGGLAYNQLHSAMGTTSPSASLPSRSCCTSSQPKRLCSTARS